MNAAAAFSVWIAGEFSQSPHGRTTAPEGIGDLVIVAISIIAVVIALFLCIRYFLLPKEKEDTHIKKIILDEEVRTGPETRHERKR